MPEYKLFYKKKTNKNFTGLDMSGRHNVKTLADARHQAHVWLREDWSKISPNKDLNPISPVQKYPDAKSAMIYRRTREGDWLFLGFENMTKTGYVWIDAKDLTSHPTNYNGTIKRRS